MKRVKLIVFIAATLLSAITAVFTYAAQTSESGTMIVITSNKTWQFNAKSNYVHVYFENFSNFTTSLSVNCINANKGTEYFTLLPKERTERLTYYTVNYVSMYNVPIEWAFTIELFMPSQVIGSAIWN